MRSRNTPRSHKHTYITRRNITGRHVVNHQNTHFEDSATTHTKTKGGTVGHTTELLDIDHQEQTKKTHTKPPTTKRTPKRREERELGRDGHLAYTIIRITDLARQ